MNRVRKVRKSLSQDVSREFLTTGEVQEYLGVCHQTLYKLIDQGLPCHRIGWKRAFLKDEIIQWIREH